MTYNKNKLYMRFLKEIDMYCVFKDSLKDFYITYTNYFPTCEEKINIAHYFLQKYNLEAITNWLVGYDYKLAGEIWCKWLKYYRETVYVNK